MTFLEAYPSAEVTRPQPGTDSISSRRRSQRVFDYGAFHCRETGYQPFPSLASRSKNLRIAVQAGGVVKGFTPTRRARACHVG